MHVLFFFFKIVQQLYHKLWHCSLKYGDSLIFWSETLLLEVEQNFIFRDESEEILHFQQTGILSVEPNVTLSVQIDCIREGTAAVATQFKQFYNSNEDNVMVASKAIDDNYDPGVLNFCFGYYLAFENYPDNLIPFYFAQGHYTYGDHSQNNWWLSSPAISAGPTTGSRVLTVGSDTFYIQRTGLENSLAIVPTK